ncbi:MAG: VCBS repeat-containing protein [Planctomycetes bacterium]|nr:VCBS repeat-containing protein [Planctomycetota bacterium]
MSRILIGAAAAVVAIALCVAVAVCLAIAAAPPEKAPAKPPAKPAAKAPEPARPGIILAFQKVKVSDEPYESCGVFDVNNDGAADIVSGAWWYPGPKFDRRHKIGDVPAGQDYFDDFSTIAADVNGDGYADFVTGGWFGGVLQWRENPRGDPAKEWPLHDIAKIGNIETTRGWDIDGDGRPEFVPNTPGGPQRVFKLITDAAGKGTGKFSEHAVYDAKTGHGMGCGDVNGDRRPDIVLAKGWLEAPAEPLGGAKWTFHGEFDLGHASIPIIVADLTGDGLADLIVGQAHPYGLDWWEQKAAGGERRWVKHPIDPFSSQYHDLVWTDIDGDGKPELVTGKRRHAHRDRDPGDADPAGVYYFKWTGEGFAKIVVDYGFGPAGKGCGIFFQVADADGDGRPDVVAPGKDGLVLYRNLGFARPPIKP